MSGDHDMRDLPRSLHYYEFPCPAARCKIAPSKQDMPLQGLTWIVLLGWNAVSGELLKKIPLQAMEEKEGKFFNQ